MKKTGTGKGVGSKTIKTIKATPTKKVKTPGNRRATKDIASTEERLNHFESLASIGTWQTDGNGIDIYWSDEFYRLHGLKPQSIKPSAELRLSMVHADDRPALIRELKKSYQTGKPYALEKRLLLLDGRIKWVLSKGEVKKEPKARPGMLGVMIDITAQKLAEIERAKLENSMHIMKSQMLQKSLNDFQMALSNSFIVSRADKAGVITYVNESFVKISGYNHDELIGQDHRIINSGLHPKSFWVEMWKTIASGQIWRADVRNKAKDGSYYWVDTFVMPFLDDKGKIHEFISIRNDITQRKTQEESIVQLNKSLMDFQQALTDSSIVSRADKAGTITFVNENFVRISGYSQEELIGQNHRIVNSGFHPKSYWNEMWKTIAKGEIWRGDVKNKAKDGNFYWVDTFVMPFLDDKGKVKEYLSVRNDITSRKKSEKELRISREKAEKANQAKSEFLANMSHEIRTPLNGVIGFTELLTKTTLDGIQNQYVTLINQSANNLLDIVNNILDFSKVEAGKIEINPEPVDLDALCKQVVGMVGPLALQKNIRLLYSYQSALPRSVITDSVRLKQILVNLLGNAVKFTEQGEIELKVEPSIKALESLAQNNEKRCAFTFSVSDTGIGIREENYDKIFNSFSQEDISVTKKYGGTGLGLSISNKLLKLMDSKLKLHSQLGKGTVFYFDLVLDSSSSQLIDEKSEQDRTQLLSRKSLGDKFQNMVIDNFKILIAEDNLINMSLVKAIIGNISPNATLVEAGNGQQAVELFIKEKPDIIFMDVQMPEMNGYSATEQIRRIEASQTNKNPTPIIALTADAVQGEREKCMEAGMNDFITKPIVDHAIEKALAAWLM